VVEVVFLGGPEPALTQARVVQGTETTRLDPSSVRAWVDNLQDVELEAVGSASGEVAVDLAHGVRLRVPAGTVLTVHAYVQGPPGKMALARPVIVGFGGDGVAVDHTDLAGVARWVDLRLSRFTLAPDGEVRLAGRAARGLDLAAQGGLRLASARITRLVREGRRFRSLLPYLRMPGSPGSNEADGDVG
jgi:hypothetical protein